MGMSVGVFLAASAFFQLFAGPLSDSLGRRPVILTSLVVFVVATYALIHARTFEQFLLLRMLQAVAAVCITLSRAIVRDTTTGEMAGARIAMVTMGMSVVPMVAPSIGGQLQGLFGWQSVFWLLMILGAILTVIVWADLGETAPGRGRSLWSQMRDYPTLLKSGSFWGYCLGATLASGAFFAYVGGASFVGAVVYELSAQEIGFFLGAPAFGYFFGNFISARYSVLWGGDRISLWGLIITAVACLLAMTFAAAGPWVFYGAMALVGLGNGLTIPNATAGMLSVRPDLAGTAAGLGSFITIGGGAALSSLASYLLTEDRGAAPLLWIMAISGTIGALSIAWVMRRKSI